MRVQVYFNLRKKCLSVRSKLTKRIVAHAQSVNLENCVFKVSEAGRQRVLATGHRNVHAWVEGDLVYLSDELVSVTPRLLMGLKSAYYNPRKVSQFTDLGTNTPVIESPEVILSHKAIFYREVK